MWGPLLFCVIIGVISLQNKLRLNTFKASQAKLTLFACGAFLFMVLCLSFVIGRDQPVSYYRFTSFTYAPLLCFCFVLLGMFLEERRKFSYLILFLGFLAAYATLWDEHYFIYRSYVSVFCILLALLCGFTLKAQKFIFSILVITLAWMGLSHFTFQNHHFSLMMKNVDRYTIGKYSIADAYRHQDGFPGRMPWGAIYPPMETIWHLLPPKTRIWSWHIHSYCMLPDCEVEGFTSFQMSPHEDVVFFGDPKKAKEYLKKENLNYFFFSTALDIRDPLVISPLFSAEHLADYFGIEWTDGVNTLLTWKEQAKLPLDKNWVKRYEEKNKIASTIISAEKFKKIFSIHDLQARYKYLKSGEFEQS